MQLLRFSRILNYFSSSPAIFPGKVQSKNVSNLLTPSKLAEKFKISEQHIRKQMINPKAVHLQYEQAKLIGIINGHRFQDKKVQKNASKCPVVTIMGHVDHGKTTLVDFLRKSNIAEGEQGGITQKIGAFSVLLGGKKVTFIDTPGHEAFVNMRQRGATVTDIIILIVSATQGVKKQTLEVIQILKRDNIKTIVAINKIDLPEANPEEVQQSLIAAGLNLEHDGGNIPVIHISAKQGTNVDLLGQLIIQETQNLSAQIQCLSQAIVLEALENQEGMNSCTLIVQRGKLKIGSILILGQEIHKIKSMRDDKGNNLNVAYPGQAVHITGFSSVPKAGDLAFELENQKKAKFIVEKRLQRINQQNIQNKSGQIIQPAKIRIKNGKQRRRFCRGFSDAWTDKFTELEDKIIQQLQQLKSIENKNNQTLQNIKTKQAQLKNHKQFVFQYFHNLSESSNKLNVIFKFSDRGIQQTIITQLMKMKQTLQQQSKLKIKIVRSDVGDITSNDINEAQLMNAKIFGFGVSMKPEAHKSLKNKQNLPKIHKLIHNFLKDFKQTVMGLKKANIKGIERGKSQIIEIYKIKTGKQGQILTAGITVTQGRISKQHKCYIIRKGVPISQKLIPKSIKSFKKEMNQVKKGDECTICFTSDNVSFQKGDQIIAYQQKQK